jgi:methylphosphotriester-DNA--protein-cysteine methyltransferase
MRHTIAAISIVAILWMPVAVIGEIIGNRNTRVYHLPWCSGYDTVAEQHRVYFDTPSEAKAAGYRLAKNCSPGGTVKSR